MVDGHMIAAGQMQDPSQSRSAHGTVVEHRQMKPIYLFKHAAFNFPVRIRITATQPPSVPRTHAYTLYRRANAADLPKKINKSYLPHRKYVLFLNATYSRTTGYALLGSAPTKTRVVPKCRSAAPQREGASLFL